MDCGTIEKQLIHYLYGELTPAESLEVSRHLETCNNCRKEFEALQMTVGILSKWQDITPTQELRDKLFERISRESWSWWVKIGNYILTANLALKTVFSVVFGVLSTFLSVFIITRYVTLTHLSPESLLTCGIIWSGTYIALFGLALYRRTIENWLGNKGISFHLPDIARHALLSIAVATILTSFILALELNGIANFKTHFINLFGEFHRGWVYFIIGGIIALISFLSSCFLLMRKLKEQSLAHVLLAGCLFTVAVAPGLTIFCVPFMLGTYLSLLSGLGLGALTGGAFSHWLIERKINSFST